MGHEPFFIEVKAEKGRVSKLQEYRASEIEKITGYKTLFLYEGEEKKAED